ncbi:MAG: low molecular weight protein arginine phosphatase [Eubacteriales bacterium]|nr:low molecular weight protein arginine phosphatase [Eubacteriales bacterium]
MNVLFVCTGNTCRSPMAEGVADDAADRSTRLKDYTFESAGTFACEGSPASEEAIEVMREIGLDIEKHKSRQFGKELAEWADVILAMEAKHIEEMEAMAPDEEHKMHTLLGYAAGIDGYPGESGYDITDPYKEPIEEYRIARDQIISAIDKALHRLSKKKH